MFSKELQAEEGQPQVIDDPQRTDAVQTESIIPYDPEHVRLGLNNRADALCVVSSLRLNLWR